MPMLFAASARSPARMARMWSRSGGWSGCGVGAAGSMSQISVPRAAARTITSRKTSRLGNANEALSSCGTNITAPAAGPRVTRQ